jgi:hypothetical protein
MKISNTEKIRLSRIQKERNEKAEKIFNKYKDPFESGTLSREILCKLPEEKQKIYFEKVFMKKYKKQLVWQKNEYKVCEHCVYSGYFESGYVSDEQVRYLCGQSSDLGQLTYSWPEVADEITQLNKSN